MSSLLERWRRDPVLWVTQVLGCPPPWPRQEEILLSVRDNTETNVVTGHGVGKSRAAAMIMLWWLFTRRDAQVLLTTPTDKQLQIIGSEIRSLYYRAPRPLGGELSPKSVELQLGPRHFLKGMVARDSQSFQGWHSPFILAVVDEAAGCAPWVDEAILGCAVGEHSRILRLANPLCGPAHPFYRTCHLPDAPGRHKTIHISSLESPNVVAGKEVIPGLMTREGVERWARYGEESSTYRSRVLGRFPTGSPDSLITLDHVAEARSRFVSDVPNPDAGEVRLGVDVGRQGPDPTIVCVRRGNRIEWPTNGVLHKVDGVGVARRVAELAQDFGALSVAIDGGGLGAGPIDALREFQRRGEAPRALDVIEVQFGARALEHERFLNRRAELWWRLRDWLREEGVADVDDDLVEELTAPSFIYQGPRIQVEAKDAVRRRLGRSTDRADALALAVSGHLGGGGELWIDHW